MADDVKQWNDDAALLYKAGYGNPPNTYSGPNDPGWLATVQAFQQDNHITPVTGLMNDATRKAAGGVVKRVTSPIDYRAAKIAGGVVAGVAVLGIGAALLTSRKGKK